MPDWTVPVEEGAPMSPSPLETFLEPEGDPVNNKRVLRLADGGRFLSLHGKTARNSITEGRRDPQRKKP